MTRHPDSYDGGGEPIYGDVADTDSLRAALTGMHAAYYLVHSLDSDDFEQRDAEAATAFGHAAADAGVRQIIYLGGLGDLDDNLSAHLRSRRDVEQLLGLGGVPVTVLRAAVVVGHGGISWEITRQLVDHLPAMVTPEVGEHQDPADRAAGRRPLPGRRAGQPGGDRPGLRGRRPRGAALRRHDAAGGADPEPPHAADRARSRC